MGARRHDTSSLAGEDERTSINSIRLRDERDRQRAQREGEPSFGRYLAQVGVLGWTIVVPTLLGVFLGRWVDQRLGTGIFWTGPLLIARSGDRLLDGMAMDARTMIAALLAVGRACGRRCLFRAAALEHDALSIVMAGRVPAMPRLPWGTRSRCGTRLAAIAVLLGFAARQGALPLLLAALGIMFARTLVLRAMQVAA